MTDPMDDERNLCQWLENYYAVESHLHECNLLEGEEVIEVGEGWECGHADLTNGGIAIMVCHK